MAAAVEGTRSNPRVTRTPSGWLRFLEDGRGRGRSPALFPGNHTMNTLLILILAIAPGEDPPVNAPAAKPKNEVEARKDARDQVLESVGKEALGFTKQYGDLGIYALRQCEPETGQKLVGLFTAGELARLRNPRAVLEAVRQHGEPAADWLALHHEQLVDPEALECWCKEPMEYVYELKDIEQQAALLRASRKYMPSWLVTMAGEWNMTHLVIGGLVLLLLVVLFLKRRPAPDL